MIKITMGQVSEKYVDGQAELITKDTEEKLILNLPSYGEDGIRIYHDGRLKADHLEKLFKTPRYFKEIQINITGWFYIHYKLNINVKEDYTEIIILNK